MAAKKQRGRSKKRSRATSRKAGSNKSGFFRTVALAAVVSFAAMSWLLHPQLQERFSPGQTLALLDLDRLGQGVERQQAVPVAAPAGGHIQTSFPLCRDFFPHQKPPIVPTDHALRELCFSSFAVLYSGQRKTPVLVAERLSRRTLMAAQNIPRTDNFYEEARLPGSERASLSDYRGSGFDRGHMAPAADMASPEAMSQSFSLANMVPQDPQHNRGIWNKIEQDTRKYVMRAKGDVYVISGPVYSDHPKTIGAGRVAVPDHLFKVVYDATTGRSWVHWQDNRADARMGPPISYEEFVKRTGLRVLE